MYNITSDMKKAMIYMAKDNQLLEAYLDLGMPYNTNLQGDDNITGSQFAINSELQNGKQRPVLTFDCDNSNFDFVMNSLIEYANFRYVLHRREEELDIANGVLLNANAVVYFLAEGKDLGGLSIDFDAYNGKPINYKMETSKNEVLAEGKVEEKLLTATEIIEDKVLDAIMNSDGMSNNE